MPALLEYVRDEPLPDRDEILARLGSHDRDVVLRILTLMCPCRNACYDADVWSKLPAIRESQWDFEVREAASHAIGTLRERARVDGRSRELIDELAARLGDGMYSPWVLRKLRKRRSAPSARDPKLARRDVPTLIELLSSSDASVVDGALALLCPGDGRHPSKRVWRAILDAQRLPDETTRRKAIAASAALDAHQMTCRVKHE
jgi:hypothetical protein